MKRVLILVEGQTEEAFVTQVLNPHLLHFSVYIVPVILRTSLFQHGKGGVSNYSRIKDHLLRLLGDTSATVVTTMFDYYRFPRDFTGQQNVVTSDPYQLVDYLERAFARDIGDPRFFPFLMLHEFEALLFADIDKLFEVIPETTAQAKRSLRQAAQQPPETIDEGGNTHPSKRILQHIPSYSKLLHGVLTVKRIGLPVIRDKCPHFNGWLTKLESL
ncbi:MAG: DUF4276 family protein [Armatimonadota bacterium]|nr:DUF4276 family protein [Armatimonadota bacterium]